MTDRATDRVAMVSLRSDGTPDQQDGWEPIVPDATDTRARPVVEPIETATSAPAERAVAPRQRRKRT